MTAEVDVFDEDTAVAGEVVLADGTTVHGFNEPLTTDEAQELTEHIRSTADVLYVLLGRAHAGKAWESLGYATFSAYVKEEFDMSRSRAYQILDQHKVIQALEAAVPDGTSLRISEAQARDLKSVIDEVVPEVQKATAGLSTEEAQKITEDIVEDYRDQVRKQNASDGDESDGSDGGHQGGGGMPGQFGGGNGGGGNFSDFGDDPEQDPQDDVPQVDTAEIRRRVQAAYDFYTAMSALNTMPDVLVVIDTIRDERIPQIREQMPVALEWLQEFAKKWEERHPAWPTANED